MVGAKNFEIAQLIAQAQLVISLQLAAVTGSADALKVFATVWTASLESSDQLRWHDVVHMAANSSLLEIHPARLDLTFPTQGSRPMFAPSLPGRSGPGPLAIHATPGYGPLLGTEAGPAINTSSVAIRVVATVNWLEHFCSSVSAIWTTHRNSTPSLDSSLLGTTGQTEGPDFSPWLWPQLRTSPH